MKRMILAAIVLLLVSGCGGGGGGGDDTGGGDGGGLSTNACSTIGLKIFSGTECTPDASSPVVSFTVDTFDGRTELCSGTLISSRHVLTAGHCLAGEGSNVKEISVDAGGRSIGLSGFAIHPGYDEREDLAAIFNDIAILELASDAGVAPLPLVLSRASAIGDVIDIFGYGLTESGGLGVLESGQMRLTDVSTSHLFSLFGDDGSNTCLGDSGGPALGRNTSGQVGIVGVTSTGTPDRLCRRGDLSLFANIQDPGIAGFIASIVPEVGAI